MDSHARALCGFDDAQLGAEPAPSSVHVVLMALVSVAAQLVGSGGRALWLRQCQVGQVKLVHRRVDPGVQAGRLNTAGARMATELAAVPLLHSLL
jgi:hypothetical protein